MTHLRTTALLVALTLVAVAAYVAVWRQAPVIEGDSPQYMEVARDLSDFSLERLHDRAPGYPLLLALTGSADAPQRSLFIVSLLLHAVSVWLLAGALRESGVPLRFAVAFGAIAMLPPYVETAAHVMTENLAQFALAAGVAGLVFWWSRQRTWLLVVSSLGLACAALTRPTYQAVAIALAIVLIAVTRLATDDSGRSKSLRAAAVLVAGSILLVGGFAVFQQMRFGYFGIVPTSGFHLTTKTMLLFERLPEEHATVREILVRERDKQLTRRGGTHTATQTVWEAREELTAATGMSTPELSKYLVRLDLLLIRKAPLEYLQEVAKSAATYWFPPAGALASMNSTALRLLWALLHTVVVGLFTLQVVVLIGWVVMKLSAGWRSPVIPDLGGTSLQATAFTVALTIVLYTMVLSCFLDIGEVRQRRPTDVIVLFACVSGVWVWTGIRQRWRISSAAGTPRERHPREASRIPR